QKGIRKTITLLCNYTNGHVISKFRLKLFENGKPIPGIHLFSLKLNYKRELPPSSVSPHSNILRKEKPPQGAAFYSSGFRSKYLRLSP
ncbi:MAG: hypothetical protein WBN69_15480, partial [Eudoraea sp.]